MVRECWLYILSVNKSAYQLAVYRYARARGVDPATLTEADHLKIGIAIRTPAQGFKDGFKAVRSKVKQILGRTVPLFVLTERKARCSANTCGMLLRAAEGSIVCGACGCSGGFMDAALNDPEEACRRKDGPKLWGVYVDEKRTGL